MNIPPIKEVPRLFLTKHYSFNLRISELQSYHDRKVFTDPKGSAQHTWGNDCCRGQKMPFVLRNIQNT
jgi:hypothetical protein